MVWADQAWTWLGVEVVKHGFRWLVVMAIMLGFGGWFGQRYWEMKKRLTALEKTFGVSPVNVTVNVGDVIKKIGRENPSYPVLQGNVAHHIPADKIVRVGTKLGAMEIRLWDEEKTVEDVLKVLSKNGVLTTLDDD